MKDLSEYSSGERRKRKEIIQRLTDPDYILAPYLEKQIDTDDPVRDGFVPIGSDLRDFTVIQGRGCYHVFYIDVRHGKHSRRPDNPFFVGHSSTSDFVHWDVHEPALQPVAGTWEAGRAGAPYVFAVGRSQRLDAIAGIPVRFVLIYTGLSRRLCQSLGMAFSNDLMSWTRYDTNPIFQPVHLPWAEWSRDRLSNCRDPHVLKIGGKHTLYYTALQKNADPCVAAAESTDLENWKDLGPVIARPFGTKMPAMLESSCVYPLKDLYVLSYTYMGGVWISVSGDPLHFGPGKLMVKGYWAMELVKQKGDRWLVAFFRQHARGRPGRLFLGVIRWKGQEPDFALCRSAREIKSLLHD